jgi:O-antigen ligase
MAAMALFAFAVASLPARALRRPLAALAASAAAVAVLGVLEGAGVRGVDPALDHFRETPFNVGGSRRATAGSEYPNLAAAFVMAGWTAAVALVARERRAAALVVPISAVFAAGLLFTYSRGALVATGIGLATLTIVFARRGRRTALVPAAALGTLVACSAAFAAAGEVFRLRLESEGTKAWYGAAYTVEHTALVLRPGERRTTRVSVTNTGRKTWTEGFNLSHHWYDPRDGSVQDGPRTPLPRALAPGEVVSLDGDLRAPEREGRYVLLWDMVQEHTSWFSGLGVPPAAVPVTVAAEGGQGMTPAPPAARLPELSRQPTRRELWGIARRMWRERPWSGFGSDSFRRLGGRWWDGRVWDARVFANDTVLEIAATTGTPGVLAFLATLATSVLAARRGLRSRDPVAADVAAAVLALLVAVAAHGVVDYVLAFTGHYLLFGFLVGAAARCLRDAA